MKKLSKSRLRLIVITVGALLLVLWGVFMVLAYNSIPDTDFDGKPPFTTFLTESSTGSGRSAYTFSGAGFKINVICYEFSAGGKTTNVTTYKTLSLFGVELCISENDGYNFIESDADDFN